MIITKTSDISKDVNVTKEPFNIYISGIDTYGEISSVSRSDVNMVVTINPKTRQILLTSIPRDYYVLLHGKSGYKDKLTHAGLYGTDMSIQTIEDLLDIEINYYLKVNFSSVIDIVNAIGGVKVYSEYNFTSIDGYNYSKGYNEVNGEEALSFARERKAFAAGDNQRIKNQQALLTAIFNKCTSKSIITKYNKFLDSLSGSFTTNMKIRKLTSLIKMQLFKNYSWNITTISLTGHDDRDYTYSAPSQKVYVMDPDEESIDTAKDLIDKVFDGEKLDSSKVEEVTETHKVTRKDANSSSIKNSDSTSSRDTLGGLEARLIKSSVEFAYGDEYTYNLPVVTYENKDITEDKNLSIKHSINGKVFDDYYELVSYVSSLDPGDYKIIFTISYKGESVILTQKVSISDFDDSSSSTTDNDKENIDNDKEDIDDDYDNDNVSSDDDSILGDDELDNEEYNN